MKTRFLISLAFALPVSLGLATQAVAAGKPANSVDKKCGATVPDSWVPGLTGEGMKAPQGPSHIRLMYQTNSMDEDKATIGRMFTVKATLDSSPARYWVEIGKPNAPARHWMVSVPAKVEGVCRAEITFDKNVSEADAKAIAQSVHAQ